MAADPAEGRDAEIGDRGAASLLGVELRDFLPRADEADLQPFDFAEPALAFGFGNAGDEVATDLDQPCPLGWVRP